MRLVDISVSKRLWAAVTLPMVAASYLAYAQSADRLKTYHTMSEIVTVSQELVTLSDIVHTLQVERGLTAGFLGSKGARGGAELRSARADSDMATSGFSGAMNNLDAAVDADLSAARHGFERQLAEIRSLRQSIDALTVNGADAFTAYTAAVDDIIALANDLSKLASDATISRRMSAYVNLMQAKETAGRERAVGNGFIVSGRVDPARFGMFTALSGQQDALIALALSTQDAESRSNFETMIADASREVEDFRARLVVNGANAELQGLDSAGWFAAATKRIDTLKQIENDNLKTIGAVALTAAEAAYRNFLILL